MNVNVSIFKERYRNHPYFSQNLYNPKTDFRFLNVEESSNRPMKFPQLNAVQKGEINNLHGEVQSNEKEGRKAEILLRETKYSPKELMKQAHYMGFERIIESKTQKNLLSTQERIQKLAQGYESTMKSMSFLKESDFFKRKSFYHQRKGQVNVLKNKLAEARELKNSELFWRLNREYQQAEEHLLHDKPLHDLIEFFNQILNELEEVNQEISILTRKQVTQLASFSPALLLTRTEGSTSSSWWSYLRRSLPSDGMERKLVCEKQLSSADKRVSEEIGGKISEVRINDVVNKLNKILRELNKLSMNVGRSKLKNEGNLSTRLLFETYIFQALNFLYESKLCDQKVLRTFFSTENTLGRTYEHLWDLSKRRKQKGKILYFTLMPELSFVLNDWNTAHLHNLLRGEFDVILINLFRNVGDLQTTDHFSAGAPLLKTPFVRENADLEKTQQAHLVELMLVGEVEAFRRSTLFPSSSPEFKSIITSVNEGGILKHWWREEAPNTFDEDQIKLWVQKLVRFFGGSRNSARRCEWVISYYLLNFIKTYGPSSRFPTLPLIDPSQDNHLLDTNYAIFEAELRLHEAAQRAAQTEFVKNLNQYQSMRLNLERSAEIDQDLRGLILKE
ncbi:hypothetical protein O181_041253 [Austropuccinia psidii MF-1]|uniref:Uncharacterized protein n=1 Tax=Austropuccinia psidii MF-1 TaxID=1389203 RepID=A0A9Q3DIT5_9BASI|nr:hypothetical protein [Austropuccinia psidii MF-1]